MKKSDVQLSYHQGSRGRPMLNVKHHVWWIDLERKYRGVTARNNKVGTYFVHEFGDDRGFWQWVEERWDSGDFTELERAWEFATRSGWEMAQEEATEIFGPRAKVYSEGRQGGWLVVHGLADIDDWNLQDLNRWSRFSAAVRGILDDLDYQIVWHLYANFYEHVREERRNLYPAPNYEGSYA